MADPLEGKFGTDKKSGDRVQRVNGAWVKVAAPKLTEDQGKSQGFARLMSDAEGAYEDATKQGYNPGGMRNTAAAFLEELPFGGMDSAGAFIRDDVGDRGRQAELQWSDAQLKAMSGAAAPEAEVKRNIRTFFPRPGEDPKEIGNRKAQARATAYGAARTRSGPASSGVPPLPTRNAPPTADNDPLGIRRR